MKRTSQWKQPRRIESAYQQALFEFLKSPTDEAANRIASSMVTAVRVRNAQGWRAAANESTKSRLIHRLLMQELNGPVGYEVTRLVRENASRIRTLPLDIAEKTNAFIASQQRRGMRSETITKELQERLPEMQAASVRLLARTETAKSETAVTQARAQSIGVHWYQWATSEDGRVRLSHRKMDGVICRFGDDPNPEALAGEKSTLGHYAPGGCPNCRCLALPLVSLDEVSWPARVYHNGSITRMTRKQFERIAA
ncbi:MAG TPA: phage minor head protein [Acidobacteriaceae bacterium]|jgi:SPP1 gp7 family putative phage head morphogenesis protein